jgi:hypothetical protein
LESRGFWLDTSPAHQLSSARLIVTMKRMHPRIKGENVTPLRRLYGQDFVVDESLWQGRIENGMSGKAQPRCDGMSRTVSFRLLHAARAAETEAA